MRHLLQFAAQILTVCLLSNAAAAQVAAPALTVGSPAAPETMIDGVAAVVNDAVITRSEVAEAARGSQFFAALSAQNPPPIVTLTPDELHASLQHLIDQTLLDNNVPISAEAAVQSEVARQLVALHARVGGDAAWQRHLQAAGLTEAAIERLVRHQVTLVAGLDQSFRNQVQIRDQAIAHYYQATLVPSLQAGHEPVPPLPEVRDRILAILSEQRLDELERQLLRDLRASAHIEVKEP